jgi:hypothetical protein
MATAAVVTIPADMTEADAERVWRDAREIVGIVTRATGGPAVGTGLLPAQVVAAAVALWDPDPPPDGTPPTQAAVAVELTTDIRTIRRVGRDLPGPTCPAPPRPDRGKKRRKRRCTSG